MGMIRRSLAFPSRARNKAAGGGAKGGKEDRRGARGGAPLAPTCRYAAQGLRGRGRTAYKVLIRGGSGKLLGIFRVRCSLRRRRRHGYGHLLPPPCPAGSDCSQPAASARSPASGAAALRPETKELVPSAAVGLLGFLCAGWRQDPLAQLSRVGWGLSGEAARRQDGLKHAR